MKKKILGLALAAMGLMLVACSSQDKTSEVIKTVEVTGTTEATEPSKPVESSDAALPQEEIYRGMDMSIPWLDSDKAGVLEATGFDMTPPADAANVAYSFMPSTGMAQMNYVMDNAMWIYRMKPAEALEDISEVYCDWDYEGETLVAGMMAMEYSYATAPQGDFIDNMSCTRVINWYDAVNKVTHSLAVLGTDLNGMDIAVFAEQLL